MQIFIATLASQPWSEALAAEFRALAQRDRIQTHRLADNAADADAILMVDMHQHPDDWRLSLLESHALVRDHASKVFVYDERDLPWCAWPGIYVCMPRSSFEPQRQRAYCYSHIVNELMVPSAREPDLLFSFQGARSHPIRSKVLALRHARGLVEDSQFNFFGHTGPGDAQEYQNELRRRKERYREIVSRSKFVLCPRGAGASSFRLYETMAAERAPVIISDEWEPPPGPDWAGCSIRVRESEADKIPQILEQREKDFAALATAAGQAYREWFAPEVMFHRLAEHCADLLQHGQSGRHPLYFLRRPYVRNIYGECRARVRAMANGSARRKAAAR